MTTYNDELHVSRNESFVYERNIINKDGTPFIVSSQLNSPMIRMTITDDQHILSYRYIWNRYLDLNSGWDDENLPRFYKTQPILLQDEEGDAPDFETAIPGDTYNPIEDIEGVTIYNYAVYYVIDSVTRKGVYKQYIHDDGGDYWDDYNYTLIIPFDSENTKDWISKNYIYGIFLMSGTLYLDVMISKVSEILVETEGYSFEDAYDIAILMSEEELYEEILNYNNKDGVVTEVALIDGREVVIDRKDERWSPYWSVDYNYPMLNSSRILVKNDPMGGL